MVQGFFRKKIKTNYIIYCENYINQKKKSAVILEPY